MGLFNKRSLIDEFEDHLDRERLAILAGDFEFLRRILTTKERLVRKILNEPELPKSLTKLKKKILLNQNLLDSAGSGIKFVSSLLDTLSLPQKPLLTYDSSGQRNVHSHNNTTKPRRA